MYRRYSKRLLDLTLAIGALLLLLPGLVFIGLLVRYKLGSPILFRQLRSGQHGKPFWIFKFRTMSDRWDASGALLPDDMRLTSFGYFLRSTSLDELPELINVVRGEMSLVGPRPLLAVYLDRYTAGQAQRHAVKPGITGWAQVHGRNALSWEDRFDLDVWYVDHQSLWLDVHIIVLTMWKTLQREGINQPGQATMEEFKGSREEASLPTR